ncbi:cysteine hydrolase family protein [Lacrimispora amygdalina]|uniref:cysteine hydrolase family protein n=1 Tax=Lacrimispora amygdalina TaxID=253257 RepID=UPI000BE3BA43|nr:isochorismatase family cysteine hydrolase [Lacrimispora amygdalina]
MRKVLIVVDMQNDFIDGSLGTKEAQAIVPKVVKKIEEYKNDDNAVIFATYDTHDKNYLATWEGINLPIEHCIKGKHGWLLNEQIEEALLEVKNNMEKFMSIEKPTFGRGDFRDVLLDFTRTFWAFDADDLGNELEIELVGLCTSICVVSNAIILKSTFPDAKIKVDSSCCACVTPETHKAALKTMQMCQIDVV